MFLFFIFYTILTSCFFTFHQTVGATVKYENVNQPQQQYKQHEQQQQQQQEQGQNQPTQQLPFCDENTDDGLNKPKSSSSNHFLYVSTLDGKISALDILNGGQMKWSISTTPGPMISSSIHNLELTNNGQWVRMIPSLSGALYKFDGETVEPIPINADNLLSSSFKFSDDLVISGGKETITYGVSAHSGKIKYECSMHHGCKNGTDLNEYTSGSDQTTSDHSMPLDKTINMNDAIEKESSIDDELIVIRRQTQTVRAIEPRTGGERWNFSVGQHELELINQPDCHSKSTNVNEFLLNFDLKVIVPEGIICAFRKTDPNVIVWKKKFDFPIVNVWKRNEMNQLEAIDLFESAQWLWETVQTDQMQTDKNTSNDSQSADNENDHSRLVPSIYIGMHKKQLYIQESEQLRSMQVKYFNELIESEKKSFARIPWLPYEASSSALALLESSDKSLTTTHNDPAVGKTDLMARNNLVTATSVLYASEYVNGNGFYLYAKSPAKITSSRNESLKAGNVCDKENGNISEIEDILFEDDDFDDFPQVNVVSLWYWWKEIMVISLTTALVLNVMLQQRKISIDPEVVIVEKHVEIKVPATPEPPINGPLPMLLDHHFETKRSLSESHTVEIAESAYRSRFHTDFDLLQCLGKGGFGVVFEVKNKLDDCNYAVKRIVLPSKKESRERVMREVKTLANCEHHNIVRYFQAWVEAPPPGWQEKEDQLWMDQDALSHSIDIDSPSSEFPPPYHHSYSKLSRCLSEHVHSVAFNSNELNSLISGLNTNECVSFDDVVRKTTFNNTVQSEDDDSFIQFKAEGEESDNEDKKQDESIKTNKEQINRGVDVSDTSDDEDDDEIDDADDEDNDDLSNSVFSSKKPELADSCSFVEFRNSIDSNADKHKRHPFKNVKNSYNVDILTRKPSNSSDLRSFSLGNDSCISMLNSADFKTNDHFKLDNKWCGLISSEPAQPFKRTHRRPQSLDLTSAGKVAAKLQLAPPTPRMYLYIQMQLCRKQSLKDWLLENDAVARQNESHSIFRQIVEAVEYVHLKGLIHRDLKPSNIFFSLDGQIKIGDFGLVTDMSDNPKAITPCGDETGLPSCARHTEQVGTHLYMSPEQLRGRQYSYKVDIYSLGLIFFELLVVFGTEMERIETLKALRSSKFPSDFPNKFPDEYNLLKIMLSKSPGKRPTTYGVRGRPPFFELTDSQYHFELPPRRRDSQSFSSNLSSSSSSSINLRKSK